MSLDVGTVKGLLELEDRFTDRLKTAGDEMEIFEAKATAGFNDVGEAAKKGGDWLGDYWKKSEEMGTKAQSLQTTLSSQAEGLKNVGGGAGAALNSILLLNQANVAMQVAMGAWSFGRQIAEYFQLDAAIGEATANLLGFGEAAEIAASHADTLARASHTMGHEITDLGIATAVNEQATREWQKSLDTSEHRIAAWRAEIEHVRSSGSLELLAKDLESHAFSLKELASRYQLSVEAIQFFTRETKNAADAEKAAADAVHDSNARKLKDLAEEMAADKAVRDQELHAAKEIADLKASAVQAEQALDLDRVHRREQTLAQLLQRDIGYEQQRLEQGKISAGQYQQNRLALETQYERQLEIELRNETEIAIAQLGNRQQKETAEANVRFQQGKISREQYEIELTLINEKYAALRNGIEERAHAELLRRLEELRQKGLAAGAPAKQFQQDWFGATEATINGVQRLIDQFGDLVDKEKEAQELARRAGGSFDVNATNFAQTIAGLGFGGQGEQLAHEGYSLAEILAILRGGPKGAPKGPRIPGFQFGVEHFGGGAAVVGEGGPELVTLPAGSNVIPFSGGGGSTTINLNVTVTGVWDARSQRELTDALSEGLVKKQLRQGYRPPLAVR